MQKIIFFLSMLVLFSYCGKDDATQDMNAIGSEDSGQIYLGVHTINLEEEEESSNLNLANSGFKNSSIASGAPRLFAIYLKKMTLTGLDDNGVSQQVPIFESKSSRGLRLIISSGLIDITELFTNFSCFSADGNVIDVPMGKTCECGVYKADGAIVEKVENSKGEKVCPWNKDFQSMEDDPSSEENSQEEESESEEKFNMDTVILPSAVLSAPYLTYTSVSITYKVMASVLGCVHGDFIEHSNFPGRHTYCTQYQHTINSGTKPSHLAFKDKRPTMTQIPLQKNYEASYSDTATLNFEIKNPIILKKGQRANLSLAIDSNRMLRFFNQGRSDQGPNPSFPVDRSYFFTTLFEDSIFVFAGRPGGIQGYEWLARHCTKESGCSEGDNKLTYVKGWMTIIFDSEGKPLVNNIMPDDDNTLTTLKGSNQGAGGIDTSLFTQKSSAHYDCSVKLDGKTATLKNINLAAARGSSQSTTFKGLYGVQGDIILIRKL
jgi:hypothetical protein